MAETQTRNPEAEQAAFDRFVATHPNTQKRAWGEKRKPRRSLRETLRGPSGRHETSTRPGERLREAREKARKLGELGVGLVLYGPAVLRAKRNYERAQKEQLAIEAHQPKQIEAGDAVRNPDVDNLFKGTAQVNYSRVRAVHRVDAPVYTAQVLTEGRHAARGLEAAPPTPAAENFDDIVDRAEELEQPAAAEYVGTHRELDPLTAPLHDLREAVTSEHDEDLPLFKQSLDAVAGPESPADDSDLRIFQETKHAIETPAPAPMPEQPASGMRNHRTFFVDHRLQRR